MLAPLKNCHSGWGGGGGGSGAGMVIFLFLNTTKVSIEDQTQQQLTTRSQQRGNVFSSQMDNKILKGGNECDRGWESNQKYSKLDLVRPVLIQTKIGIRIIPGTE